MRIRAQIIEEIERFITARGLSERQFGIQAAGDHKLLKRLREGAGITLSTIERVEAFIASPDEGAAETSVDEAAA